MQHHRLSFLLVALASGCGADAGPVASQGRALVAPNGVHLNGVHLNGVHLNGVHLNGVHLNGVHLNGVHLNGVHLNGVHLNGSLLAGVAADGAELSGEGLVGAELDGELDGGDPLPLRIDGVSFADNDERDPVFYQVAYKAAGEPAWQPLCADGEGTPLAAIAVPGVWSYEEGVPGGGAHADSASLFTLACIDGAIAKCVDFGYKPWGTVDVCDPHGCAPVSLARHHQACTRLLRADYCGDGRSHTTDGRAVNLYDDVGVERDTNRWAFEAEWSEGGAVCMSDRRDPEDPVPPCLEALARASCGAHRRRFAEGTLLVSEFQR